MSEVYCPACEVEHEEPECPPVPQCDLCGSICKPDDLVCYRPRPFDPLIQAELSICLECERKNL